MSSSEAESCAALSRACFDQATLLGVGRSARRGRLVRAWAIVQAARICSVYEEPFDDPDAIWDQDVLEYGPKRVAQELLRAQLDADAQRGDVDTTRFRARLRIARNLEIPVIDLQRRTGVARQTVYNAAKRPIGNELEDLSVLSLITAGAAQTLPRLVEAIGATEEQLRQALSRLHAANYIQVLAGLPAPEPPPGVFALAAKGLRRLQIETDSERLRSTHSDAWTVFIAIEEAERGRIAEVADRVLGGDRSFGIIDAAVAPSRMTGAEFAVMVRAPDSREALLMTQGLWTRLKHDLPQLPPTPPVVAISPPSSG